MRKKIIHYFIASFVVFSFFALPLVSPVVVAQVKPEKGGGQVVPPKGDSGSEGGGGQVTPTRGDSIKLKNPLDTGNIQTIPDLVKAILEIALKIGVPLIALAIIYAGFKFIAAQGNPEKLKEAKQTLIYVVIGAAILLAAYAIATAIVNTVTSVTG